MIKETLKKIYNFIKRHWKLLLFLVSIVIIALIVFSYSGGDIGVRQELIDEERANIESKEDTNNEALAELEEEVGEIDKEINKLEKEAINEANTRLDAVIDKYKHLRQ